MPEYRLTPGDGGMMESGRRVSAAANSGRREEVKKVVRITAVVLACLGVLLAVVSVFLFFYVQKPHVRFVLNMSGLREPTSFTEREINLEHDGASAPVLIYQRPGESPGRYMLLLHGFAPEGHRDPRMKRMAASICDATGIGVMVPGISSMLTGHLKFDDIMREISGVYTALARAHPGRYYAFGACMGASLLVLSLNDVPRELYPKKLLLFGPIADGSSLLNDYNSGKMKGADIILKLAVTANMGVFSEKERDLIRKAMLNAGTGRTDESRMKQILGDKLFHDISIVSLKSTDIESLDAAGMLGGGADLPESRFYIMHSRNDSIVPSTQGKSISEFIQSRGGRAPYLETGLFDHADTRITATSLAAELNYMLSFFADFFDENTRP